MGTERTKIVSAEHVFVVIRDNDQQRQGLREMIEFLDTSRVIVSSPEEWRQLNSESRLAAVFLEEDLGKEKIDQVFSAVGELDANAPIILVSHDPNTALEARQKFSWAHIFELGHPIPFDELDSVLEEVWALHRKKRHRDANRQGANELIGNSHQLRTICELIERVAPTDSTVLLTGESGTGKEVVARRIHDLSGRKGEFVAINCGAIPDHLMESELFGHERGAFTGAAAARMGRFEFAAGGTLFLDEIGDMPKALQVKLLRVLQERRIERIGGVESTPLDIRLIAATHRDLPKRIEDGLFREDLYYRLSVFPIDIPPLRERRDDIRPLLDEFTDRVRRTHDVRLRFSTDAISCLEAYAWPGNVRELANFIERLAVIGIDRLITEADLPLPIRPSGRDPSAIESDARAVLPEGGINLKDYLTDIERRAIQDALSVSDGVVQAAADLLGMGRTTLVEKIKRLGIDT